MIFIIIWLFLGLAGYSMDLIDRKQRRGLVTFGYLIGHSPLILLGLIYFLISFTDTGFFKKLMDAKVF